MSFARVSVIADGKLLQPSVAQGTASGGGYHLLVVEGYSRAKDTPNRSSIKGRPFTAGGHRWVLKLFPNGGCSETSDFVSVRLTLDQDAAQPVKVHLQFSFIDEVDKQEPAHVRGVKTCEFSSSSLSWGRPRFQNREAFEKSEHLKDDCFTIRCDLIIADSAPAYIEVPPCNICQHLNHLLEGKIGADVTFEVSGETFPAHRCVLAARSTVFMAELFGPMKEAATNSVIQIDYMEAKVFKAMLAFVYTDSMPKMMEVDGEAEVGRAEVMWLQQLLVAADRYDLQRLKSMCEQHLSERINVSFVSTILALAGQHHCCGLKEACLDFLKVQSAAAWKQVMATIELEHIAVTYPSVLNELITKFASKV